MNNSEQPKPAQEPKPVAEILKDSREGVEAWQKSRQERMAQGKAGQVPQSEAEQRKTSEWEKAQDLGKVIQERRRQREEAARAGAEPTPGEKPTGVTWESGAEVQERMEGLKKILEEGAGKRAIPEINETSKEADEESKEAQWKAAAVRERETSMEKMRRLFTPHGETGGAETKTVETAKQTREETVREISQHLVEHPEKALSIFKKGVSLKLEKAAIGFTSFWKRAGAEALRGAVWPAEKVVGSSLAKLNETVWAFQEHLLTRPGAKRLEKVLAIQANIEALKKAGAITEGHADYLLAEIMRHIRHATGDLLAETQDHYSWEEKKEKTLDLIKTFGHSRKKLSGWGKEQKAKAAGKKETAKHRRIREAAGKLKQ